jgi:hypothetical protein
MWILWRFALDRKTGKGITYRTHDGRLPVELLCRVSMLFWAITLLQPEGRCRLSYRNRVEHHIPDHLRWDRPSRKKEGHCRLNVSRTCKIVFVTRAGGDGGSGLSTPHCGQSCEQTAARKRADVPAEVGEFLVDTLKSHGAVCVADVVCSITGVLFAGRKGVWSWLKSVGGLQRERQRLAP